MRRFLYSSDMTSLETEHYDVLIIGSGIAGLYASLHIDPSLTYAIISKSDIEKSSSWYAQGGIAAVISPEDNFSSHIEDTLKAGAGLCDEEAVRVLVSEGPENIKELVELDVPFDLNPEGELQITREGGHSMRRIVHCGGDATGRETTRRLSEIALERKNVTFLFGTYLIDILTDENNCAAGAVVYCSDSRKSKIISSQNVVICTGGIGYLYKYTTNPRGSVGDGISAAQRAGAEIKDMEMVQFHPTTLISPEFSERLFLISEAVRGEGGILKNHENTAFMEGVHPLKDLAPRDIVTRAILAELQRTGEDHVFLDVSSMDEEFFLKRFPTISGECRRYGVNVPFDMIPVRPAQHYLMGGIKTNLHGMTSIEGLYACGEAACTGIHGANRLASNSVLECLVFGRRVALHINASLRKKNTPVLTNIKYSETAPTATKNDINRVRNEIRDIMSTYAGAIRTQKGISTGIKLIGEIIDKYSKIPLISPSEYEIMNMAQTGMAIFDGASKRKESVGAHYLTPDK